MIAVIPSRHPTKTMLCRGRPFPKKPKALSEKKRRFQHRFLRKSGHLWKALSQWYLPRSSSGRSDQHTCRRRSRDWRIPYGRVAHPPTPSSHVPRWWCGLAAEISPPSCPVCRWRYFAERRKRCLDRTFVRWSKTKDKDSAALDIILYRGLSGVLIIHSCCWYVWNRSSYYF